MSGYEDYSYGGSCEIEEKRMRMLTKRIVKKYIKKIYSCYPSSSIIYKDVLIKQLTDDCCKEIFEKVLYID
jgi:hypothetical protein